MKKTLITALVIALALSLAACGKTGGGDHTSETPKSSSETAKPSSTETKPSSETATTPEPTEPSDTQPEEAEPGPVTVEEQVLLDEGGYKITLKGFTEADDMFGPELEMLFENSSDKDVTFYKNDLSANGYMVSGAMAVDVAKGSAVSDVLLFWKSSLKAAGISVIADVGMSFAIVETASGDTILESDPVVIKTSAYEGYQYTFDDSGDLLYQDEDLKIVVKGISYNDIVGLRMTVYIENNSDVDLSVDTSEYDCRLNGERLYTYLGADVLAGKKCIEKITLQDAGGEITDPDMIEELKMGFTAVRMNGGDRILDTGPLTVEP